MVVRGIPADLHIARQFHPCEFDNFTKHFKSMFLDETRPLENPLFSSATLLQNVQLCSNALADLKRFEFTFAIANKGALLPHSYCKATYDKVYKAHSKTV